MKRITGGVEVAQDPMRNPGQAVAELERQAGERLPIASLRLLHQGPIHHSLRWWSRSAPLKAYGVGHPRIGSMSVASRMSA